MGNAAIANIPNAALALSDGEAFQVANPIKGIALIEVIGLPGDRVRVAITGTDAPPVATARTEAQRLVFGVGRGEAVATDEE